MIVNEATFLLGFDVDKDLNPTSVGINLRLALLQKLSQSSGVCRCKGLGINYIRASF